jgi:hypothetical protein
VGHLQAKGFAVTSADVPQAHLMALKDKHSVPQRLRSCHTGVIEHYVIEGHVPGDVIARLLKERPDVLGLAVPGMPIGSPGMEGPNPKPYDVLSFDKDGRIQVYERLPTSYAKGAHRCIGSGSLFSQYERSDEKSLSR